MGKVIIIKDADFSANAIDKITPIIGEKVNFETLDVTDAYINSYGKWKSQGECYLISVQEGDSFIMNGNGVNNSGYALVNLTGKPVSDSDADFAPGETGIHTVGPTDKNVTIEVPADCSYLYAVKTALNISHLCGSLYKILA